MPNVLSSQILENGPRFIVAKYTNVSDGTAETGVTKLDATSTGPFGIQRSGQMFYPGVHLSIVSIWFSVAGMALRLQWRATANVDIVVLTQSDSWIFLDHRGGFGGLTPPVGVAGITGSIDFTTVGAAANSAYTVILKCTKNAGQE
jgi:hypothetical protein